MHFEACGAFLDAPAPESYAGGMSPEPSRTGGGPSSRGALLAGAAVAVVLLLATLTAASWPEIELRYHRYYFRRGTPVQQLDALEWICERRLRRGMTRAEVEHVLGEKLEKRFGEPRWSLLKGDASEFSTGAGFIQVQFDRNGKWAGHLPAVVFSGSRVP